jgi:hypothetical protein
MQEENRSSLLEPDALDPFDAPAPPPAAVVVAPPEELHPARASAATASVAVSAARLQTAPGHRAFW